MTDEEIFIGLINKDEDVLNYIVNEYSQLLWAIASKYIVASKGQAQQDIEELISDVFLRLWQNPQGYQIEKGSVKTYLAVMTRSMALNKIKSKKKNQVVELFDTNLPEFTEEEVLKIDWQEFFRVAMTLEEPTREIIIKRYFCDMKPAEIKKVTGFSIKLIDNKLYYGNKKLREQLTIESLNGQIFLIKMERVVAMILKK